VKCLRHCDRDDIEREYRGVVSMNVCPGHRKASRVAAALADEVLRHKRTRLGKATAFAEKLACRRTVRASNVGITRH